jgi:hypothetical protein
MKQLRLVDPNGHTVTTSPVIVTTDAHADHYTAWLLDTPANAHAELMRRMEAHNTVMLGNAASASRNAHLVYQPDNYTVLALDITPDQVAQQVAHYAARYLSGVDTPEIREAAYGVPLAGLLGEPELRGEDLYQAAVDALVGWHQAA